MQKAGFTLIELSIVLVIIGLIVGGVLVGQDLIRSAGVRATITQVERYNTAVNTFRGKYGYLPGDIPDPAASSFGFVARGGYAGTGDGNGIIQGNDDWDGSGANGGVERGETVMFWVDLSQAGLIEGRFSTASATDNNAATITASSSPALSAFLPPARLGNGNYFVVWSGTGTNGMGITPDANYFSLANVSLIPSNGFTTTSQGLTVAQAYSIDRKMDDGLPYSGNVSATYLGSWGDFAVAAGTGYSGAYGWPGNAVTASALTCADNGGNSADPPVYSMEINGGNGVNCGLDFKMQAGD